MGQQLATLLTPQVLATSVLHNSILTILTGLQRINQENFKQPPPHFKALSEAEQEKLLQDARLKLQLNGQVFNFGITGQSRTGKSSLINGLRMIHDSDSDAAPVGEVETTRNITKYTHPNEDRFVLWDMPGAGTYFHPIRTYLQDKCLLAFDCLILVCE